MKQMVRDIRAAWPRERRFTWRGWVLVGVFFGLVVAAWRGWDPVHMFLSILNKFNHEWPMSVSNHLLIWAWIGSMSAIVSIMSLPGIVLAMRLMRPRVHWLWFMLIVPMAMFMPALEFAGLTLLRRIGVQSFPAALVYMLWSANAVLWGLLLSRVMRSRWAVLLVLASLATAIALSWVFEPYRRATRGAATIRVGTLVYGVETIVFQLILAAGLIWIALRSWRVRPEHLCRTCNYDTRGLKAGVACPECGTVTPGAERA